ncbi:MAG: hypothetical protein ACO3JL_01710 [Myxococcota bacterium]
MIEPRRPRKTAHTHRLGDGLHEEVLGVLTQCLAKRPRLERSVERERLSSILSRETRRTEGPVFLTPVFVYLWARGLRSGATHEVFDVLEEMARELEGRGVSCRLPAAMRPVVRSAKGQGATRPAPIGTATVSPLVELCRRVAKLVYPEVESLGDVGAVPRDHAVRRRAP